MAVTAKFTDETKTAFIRSDEPKSSIPTGTGKHRIALAEGIIIADHVPVVLTWKENRQSNLSDGGYGTVIEQMEILGEQGIGAFMSHIAAVKAAHPKPV